jgi:hypothetical protein
MMLVCANKSFDLIWHPHEHHNPLFLPIPDSTTSTWATGQFTRLSAEACGKISLESDDSAIYLTWQTHTPSSFPRRFQIPHSHFYQVARLIEQLILNTIATPSVDPPSLLFCPPPYHRLSESAVAQTINPTFTTFRDFWNGVFRFFHEVVWVLEDLGFLTISFLYETALDSQRHLLSEVNTFILSILAYQKVTDVNSLFDSNGRLSDPDILFSRLFLAGADRSTLRSIIPFALGLFPPDSTFEDRTALEATFVTKHETIRDLRDGRRNLGLPPINGTAEIKIDVWRAPDLLRGLPKEPLPRGAQLLADLLHDYSVHNPGVGYVQGMDHMMTALILAHVDHFDDLGVPLDSSGAHCAQSISPIVFACFDAMLERVGHPEILQDLGKVTRLIEAGIDLLRKESPFMGLCLSKLRDLIGGLTGAVPAMGANCSFTWGLWLHFWCAPEPAKWWPYFWAGFFAQEFHRLVLQTGETPPSLEVFRTMDLDLVMRTALWFYRRHPPVERSEPSESLVQVPCFG